MAYSSYYKNQKYVTYQQQDPLPYIPLTYSVDGEGTLPLVLKDECDPNCGCTGGTHDYSQDYLTFIAYEDGTFKFVLPIDYSMDDGLTWNSLSANTATPTVTAGNRIIWKGNGWVGMPYEDQFGVFPFSSTGRFIAEGNAMSLVSGDSFTEATTVDGGQFSSLFSGCTGLTSAKNLVLPATTIGKYCYGSMFQGCTSLTAAPALPATTLANYCYQNMFSGCTSLTTAPALPATTLTEACYAQMFSNCTSLTTAPELPATTMENYCYQDMFYNCRSLTTAPELPATTLVLNCYAYMFQECTSLNYIKCLATDISATDCTIGWVAGVAASGTFVKNASMNDWPTGLSGMDGIPNGWTVVNA